jgi:septal ring factor EnvC (AmiA/AmiB activator)
MKKFLNIVGICIALFVGGASADVSTMHDLQSNIKSTKANINKFNAKLNLLNSKLRIEEQSLAEVNQKISANKQLLQINKAKIQALNISQNIQNAQLAKKQDELRHDIAVSYKLISQPLLKRFFSDVNDQQRLLYYHRVLVSSQIEKIQAIQLLLDSVNKSQQQLNQEKNQLQQNTDTLQASLVEHKQIMQQRSVTMQNLQSSLALSNQRLQQMEAERQALEYKLSQMKFLNSNKNRFKKQQGKLAWPVSGTITHAFGSQVEQTELRYTGVVIAAQSGAPVHAIAPGKVLFAEWLAGYGLLVIIDHGDGYLSLYGRNQRLNVQVGDVVNKGDTIAWVGMSGGFSSDSLYFALRHIDEPLNPSKWCTYRF